MSTISYHAHHSPIGANATFTIGKHGARGGFAIDSGQPANQDIHIGIRKGDGPAYLLPFYKGADADLSNYLVEGAEGQNADNVRVLPFEPSAITRTIGWGTDTWAASGVTFELATAFDSLPDPMVVPAEEMKLALVPAIIARITFDNSDSAEAATGFFALDTNIKPLRSLEDSIGHVLKGIAFQREWGLAVAQGDPAVQTFIDYALGNALKKQVPDIFRIGTYGGIQVRLAPGEKKTVTVALGFYKGGFATTGLDTRYFYTNYFSNLEEVLSFALENADSLLKTAHTRDAELAAAKLHDDQRFMIAHATRSYYGNTEFLDAAGQPLWVVNEGEYQMMNTFDLTVDMLFYELRFNPWTVKNVLDLFADRYSYFDQVKHPDAPDVWYPGGISFTHDMGAHNQFSPAEYSSYEIPNRTACFSYMTHEQLVNWVLCASLYMKRTDDTHWLERRRGIFRECLTSLLHRDGRTPEEYDGVMNMESSRCGDTGQEITTYDSLDASLGQSRNNLYLATKSWASYVCLQQIFRQIGWEDLALEADAGAVRAAKTITGKFIPEEGYIPAVFEEGNASRIIPAIEGLVFPYLMGDSDAVSESGRYGELIRTLKAHFTTVLAPGVCIDADGHWWKMSSTSNNTWFSKVAICQFVARQILGFDFGEEELVFDRAHADWQRIGSSEWAMCDQIVGGEGVASKYYPRCVSDILWLEEDAGTAVLTPVY